MNHIGEIRTLRIPRIVQNGRTHLFDILIILASISFVTQMHSHHSQDFRRPEIIGSGNDGGHTCIQVRVRAKPMLGRIIIPASCTVPQIPCPDKTRRHHRPGTRIMPRKIIVILLQPRIHKSSHFPVRCLGKQFLEGEKLRRKGRSMVDECLLRSGSCRIGAYGFKGLNRIQTGQRPGDKARVPCIKTIPVLPRSEMTDILTFCNNRICDIGKKRRFNDLFTERILFSQREHFLRSGDTYRRDKIGFICVKRPDL